jgi:DNA-directed RNA polymerase specialized sigma24 family protein
MRLATWLARIAMNEALGRLRRQRPSVDVNDLAPGVLEAQIIQFPLAAASEDPEKSMAQRESSMSSSTRSTNCPRPSASSSSPA